MIGNDVLYALQALDVKSWGEGIAACEHGAVLILEQQLCDVISCNSIVMVLVENPVAVGVFDISFLVCAMLIVFEYIMPSCLAEYKFTLYEGVFIRFPCFSRRPNNMIQVLFVVDAVFDPGHVGKGFGERPFAHNVFCVILLVEL